MNSLIITVILATLDKILEEIEEENELYKVKKELRKQFYGTHTA